MANIDAPFGILPAEPGCHKGHYSCDADCVTLRIGDVVLLETDGYINLNTPGTKPEDVIGICAQYHAKGAAANIEVWDDLEAIYKVQCVSGTTPTQAMIGDCCDHVSSGKLSASSTCPYSQYELNIGTLAGDEGTAQFSIVGFKRSPDNALSEHAVALVRFREGAFNKYSSKAI